jgi:redox-sensitive bicupin YhaK (pirin superfamily)
MLGAGRAAYFYVLEGGPVESNGIHIPKLDAAKIKEESELSVEAKKDAELLLVEVLLV